VTIVYKSAEVAKQRLDLVVDARVVLEIKSGFHLPRGATHQILNYVRATGYESGVLFHFGPEPWFYRVDGTRLHPRA
jgi:GxxExxY protein